MRKSTDNGGREVLTATSDSAAGMHASGSRPSYAPACFPQTYIWLGPLSTYKKQITSISPNIEPANGLNKYRVATWPIHEPYSVRLEH